MKSLENLDSTYNTYDIYDCLTVCSNQLINTVHVLQTSFGWIPFSIRKGESPRVWLSAPVEFDSNNNPIKFIDLIVNSVPLNDKVHLINSKYGFQIKIDDVILMEAGNHDGDNLEIIKIDLSPIGLTQLKGDIKGLTVGGMTMSRSGTRGASSFLSI